MTCHVQHKQRHGQDQANPETPPHVHPFRVRLLLRPSDARLQGHAALGAAARTVADNLRVHWADILELGSGRSSLSREHTRWEALLRERMALPVQIAPGINLKLLRTMRTAEIVFLPLVFNRSGR